MKLWKFYKVPDEDEVNKEYPLYAVTNEKDIAKEFKETRNMEKFIVQVSKDEPKNAIADFINSNYEMLLKRRDFTTGVIAKNGKFDLRTAKIVCTDYEYVSICENPEILIDIAREEFWYNILPPYIFKKKVLEALRVLEYHLWYKLYTVEFNQLIDPSDDDYSAPDAQVDELACFIRFFGDTFK